MCKQGQRYGHYWSTFDSGKGTYLQLLLNLGCQIVPWDKTKLIHHHKDATSLFNTIFQFLEHLQVLSWKDSWKDTSPLWAFIKAQSWTQLTSNGSRYCCSLELLESSRELSLNVVSCHDCFWAYFLVKRKSLYTCWKFDLRYLCKSLPPC